MTRPPDILVMGVSGSGKSTLGRALAEVFGSVFLDADDFHPPENIAKMSAGVALTDEDRAPWLEAIAEEMERQSLAGRSIVLACSALKERYRQVLSQAVKKLNVVILEGTPDQVRERLLARRDHFMPPALLESQLAALEPPADAIRLEIGQPVTQLVARTVDSLDLLP